MLRSATTPNRTEVQSNPEMKQTTIRRILSTPTASVRSACALAPFSATWRALQPGGGGAGLYGARGSWLERI
jgi:hypothetical protein